MAKFYGIGTGPGDSSLLTIKAVETLQNLDTLYTPEAKKGGESLALSIVSKYLPDGLEIKSRHFPMNFNDAEKILAWNQIADEIVEDVRAGKNVGFVTLGRSYDIQHICIYNGKTYRKYRCRDNTWNIFIL